MHKFTHQDIADYEIEMINEKKLAKEYYEDIFEKQFNREEELINEYVPCGNKQLVIAHLPEISPSQIASTLRDNFFEESVPKAISCITDSIVKAKTSDNITVNERIRHYIQNLVKFGEKSETGNAFKADLDGANDLFVIKVPKDTNDDLIHEAIVGLYGTNLLREIIPNFSYVYAFFTCSAPILDSSENALTWCTSDKILSTYIIYENITPSVTFLHIIKNESLDIIFNCFMQIICALFIAYDKLDFTHYDMHAKNILVRMLQKEVIIKYPLPTGDVYIKTDRIPIFIDYGMSHIKIGSDHFGMTPPDKFIEYGIHQDKSFPLHDVYKIIGNMYHMTNNTNKIPIYDLLKYFREGTIDMQYDYNRFFSAPYNQNTSTFKYEDFIVYCNQVINQNNIADPFVIPVSGDPILSCAPNCHTLDEMMSIFKINTPIPVPKTLFEFWDSYPLLDEKIINSFNVDNAFNDQLTQTEKLINELDTFVYNRINLPQTLNQSTIHAWFMNIKDESLPKFIDKFSELVMYIRLLKLTVATFGIKSSKYYRLLFRYNDISSMIYQKIDIDIETGFQFLKKVSPERTILLKERYYSDLLRIYRSLNFIRIKSY